MSLFAVDSGACVAVGNCIQHAAILSSAYGSGMSCVMRPVMSVLLTVVLFNVEADSSCEFDWLQLPGGSRYCGTSGPEGLEVHAGAPITFTSDSSVTGAGFK
eukprot:1579072-Prymnesium_polylepis.1